MMDLGEVIDMLKEQDKQARDCGSRGHPGEHVLCYEYSLGRAYCYCSECNSEYFRAMNPAEIYKILERLEAPMTI